jgi:hypothetical protein
MQTLVTDVSNFWINVNSWRYRECSTVKVEVKFQQTDAFTVKQETDIGNKF